MTSEIHDAETVALTSDAFGIKLKHAREKLNLEQKDVAAQLRLSESTIIMMESDSYPDDLPATFLRGYLRAYAKFLQLPEGELSLVLHTIKDKVVETPNDLTTKPPVHILSNPRRTHYSTQIATVLIIFTLISLVSLWWYNHKSPVLEPQLANSQDAVQKTDENKTVGGINENNIAFNSIANLNIRNIPMETVQVPIKSKNIRETPPPDPYSN